MDIAKCSKSAQAIISLLTSCRPLLHPYAEALLESESSLVGEKIMSKRRIVGIKIIRHEPEATWLRERIDVALSC